MAEHNIIAVMVTYNFPENFSERLDAILNEVSYIFIIDNASNQQTKDALKEVKTQYVDKLEVLWNKENLGLASALNQGIQCALDKGAEWVLLLDHDSQPESGMIDRVLEAYNAYPKKHRIGIIAPEIKEQNTATETRYLIPKGTFFFQRIALSEPYRDDVLSVITSGSLIKANIFNEVGLMPEHFFIDYIDHAFCLKMRKLGYTILLVKDAILKHRLGNKMEHSLAGAKIISSHHSPLRRYYIFRNRIWIWKQYVTTFPNFVIHDILASLFDIMRIVFYEQQKWQKLKAIMKGIGKGFCKEKR